MDPIVIILGILITLLGGASNIIILLLFWRIKRMDADIELLKIQIADIRINYMDRFDDVKEHQYKLHLDIKEKFSILETLIHKSLKK
jgi:hypothetical protein